VPVSPDQYAAASAYDLLKAAARGLIGFDHRLLHVLVDEPRRTLPDILRFALEDRWEDRIDLEEELIGIFGHLKTAEALPFYLSSVRRDPAGEASEELMAAFREIGEPAIGPLVDLYEEVGEEAGGEIAYMLSSFRHRDERILRVLEGRLDQDPLDGLMLIGLHGDPAARPRIEKLVASLDPTDRSASLLRREAQYALEHFSAPEPEPFPEPGAIWDRYPENSGPALEILDDGERAALLENPSEEYRAAAADYFFAKDLSRPLRDRLLHLAQTDPSTTVRAACWRALGGALDEKGIRDALVAKLTEETAPLQERSGALVGLAFETDQPAVVAQLLLFYENPNSRARALETMWRSLNRRFAGFFPRHLDDADPDVRRQAIWGVGYLGIGGEADRLGKFFDDEEFRADALFAYALSVPAEVSRGRARGLLRRINETSGGLTPEELDLVKVALDERLALHGLDPVFDGDDRSLEDPKEDAEPSKKVGRNELCPCGSGKKYKKCCGRQARPFFVE